MGGGAPLAFLNKKTWHPGRMQNLEEVWKREQQAEAEQRKLEELRKQYEDERKSAEFTQMAEEAGYKKDSRLDWMYAGSLAAKNAAAAAAAGSHQQQQQQQAEQPLMGKQPAPDEHLSRAERAAALPSLLAVATPASQNEAWARLNNDPLLAIKKQEQDALKRVRENPVKMQQILKEVEKVRGLKHKKEKKDKKEKKEKKERRDRKRSRSKSRSRSDSPARRRPAAAAAAAAMPPPPARDGRRYDGGYAAAADGGGSTRGRSPHSRPPAAAPARREDLGGRDRGDYCSDRQYPTAATAGGRSDRRSRSRSRSRDRARRRQQQQQQPEQEQQRTSSHHHSHSSRSRADEDRGQHNSSSSHHRRHDHHESSRGPAAGSDAAAGDNRYGLKLAAGHRHAPVDKDQQAADAAAHAAATRQRLAQANGVREAEAAAAAAAAAAQRRQRSEYKPGKLSAEEKAARLAAMMGDAAEHDRQRHERLHQARAAEADDQRGVAGLLAKAAAAKAEDAFKSAAAAEVFGSLAGGGMSLDARISSRRHYHER